MKTVTLGNHLKIVAPPSKRERIRSFYTGVLGAKLAGPGDHWDVFELSGGTILGVEYGKATLPAATYRKATWLELRTGDVPGLKKRLKAFGVAEVKYADRAHLYFQAPDGQVYRVMGRREA